MELGKPPFGIGSERFNAVDMSFAVCELVLPMVDTIMLFVAQVNKATVAAPVIRMHDAVRLSIRPRIMASSVLLAQSGTISV